MPTVWVSCCCGGVCLATSSWSPRATVLEQCSCLNFVSGIRCCLVRSLSAFVSGPLFGWCLVSASLVRTGKVPGTIFWGNRLVLGRLSAFAPPGAVPVVGGYLYPSVLRSPGVSPQKCRAHGPLHPAVTIPPRLCLIGDWSSVRCFRDSCLVFCVVFLVVGEFV